jgi:hypothetical protein
MTEINGKLCVATYKSNVLDVYDSQYEGIKVQGMIYPIDIVACSTKIRLYIADSDHRAIWWMGLDESNVAEQLITFQWMPFSMSMQWQRMLLTPYVGATLHSNNDDGEELNHIALPGYMQATHAVETANKTVISVDGSMTHTRNSTALVRLTTLGE